VHEQFRDLFRAAARSRAHRRYSCSAPRWAKRREVRPNGLERSAFSRVLARERVQRGRKKHRDLTPYLFFSARVAPPRRIQTVPTPARGHSEPCSRRCRFCRRSLHVRPERERRGTEKKSRETYSLLTITNAMRTRDNAERTLLLAIVRACLGRAKKCQSRARLRAHVLFLHRSHSSDDVDDDETERDSAQRGNNGECSGRHSQAWHAVLESSTRDDNTRSSPRVVRSTLPNWACRLVQLGPVVPITTLVSGRASARCRLDS